jgi:hypothetical protein
MIFEHSRLLAIDPHHTEIEVLHQSVLATLKGEVSNLLLPLLKATQNLPSKKVSPYRELSISTGILLSTGQQILTDVQLSTDEHSPRMSRVPVPAQLAAIRVSIKQATWMGVCEELIRLYHRIKDDPALYLSGPVIWEFPDMEVSYHAR